MKFHTGGTARDPLKKVDLVKFQSQRYSPDKRRNIVYFASCEVFSQDFFKEEDFR